MIKFRIRYRPFTNGYPSKMCYVVNIHSVDAVNGEEKSGGYLGLLRMTEKEFDQFRLTMAGNQTEFVEQE